MKLTPEQARERDALLREARQEQGSAGISDAERAALLREAALAQP